MLDASAVLALLFKEPGGQAVVDVVARAAVSTVNWVEVWRRCRTVGYDPSEARDRLLGVGLVITALSTAQAERAAELRDAADVTRCCLIRATRTGSTDSHERPNASQRSDGRALRRSAQ